MHFASHHLFSVKTDSEKSLEKYCLVFSMGMGGLMAASTAAIIFLSGNKKLLPDSFGFKELFLQLYSLKATSKFSGAKSDKRHHLTTSFIVAKPFQPSGLGMKSRGGSPPPSLVRTGALRNIFIFRMGA